MFGGFSDSDIARIIFGIIARTDVSGSGVEIYSKLSHALRQSETLSKFSGASVFEALLLRPMHPHEENGVGNAELIVSLVNSAEFFAVLPRLISHVWPSKRRKFFIHIPKTAGNSVLSSIHNATGIEPWNAIYNHPVFFLHGVETAAQLKFMAGHFMQPEQDIWYVGHYYLKSIVDGGYIKAGDTAFAVIRHPIDMIISQFNFMLTIAADPNGGGIRDEWLTWISACVPGWDGHVESLSMADYPALLRSPYFRSNHANQLCKYLFNEGASVLDAISLCEQFSIGIVNLPSIADYGKSHLGLNMPIEKKNASQKYIKSFGEMSIETKLFILDTLVSDDLKFYEIMTH